MYQQPQQPSIVKVTLIWAMQVLHSLIIRCSTLPCSLKTFPCQLFWGTFLRKTEESLNVIFSVLKSALKYQCDFWWGLKMWCLCGFDFSKKSQKVKKHFTSCKFYVSCHMSSRGKSRGILHAHKKNMFYGVSNVLYSHYNIIPVLQYG